MKRAHVVEFRAIALALICAGCLGVAAAYLVGYHEGLRDGAHLPAERIGAVMAQ